MSISPRLSPARLPGGVTLHNADYRFPSHRRFVDRITRLIGQQAALGRQGINELGPRLLPWIADVRNLRAAWDHLRSQGGEAPGPNGLRYEDLSLREVVQLLKRLHTLIMEGAYEPGPELRVWIAKGSGKGSRRLSVQNIQDRVVARACVQILQPLIKAQFRQVGSHGNSDRLKLLATVERQAIEHGRVHLVKNDIRDAFDNVPRGRLVQILPKYIPSPDVVGLLSRIVGGSTGHGLRQGSALSPLLLDLYLDHFLIRPWQVSQPETVLLNYVDDILILASSSEQAEHASQHLTTRLRECGFHAKYTALEAVGCLDSESTEWLGMKLSLKGDRLAIIPHEKTWERLREHLAAAQERPGAAQLASQIVLGWFGQLGPCYDDLNRADAIRRAQSLANDQGFDEVPTKHEIREIWQRAHAYWLRLRAMPSLLLDTRTAIADNQDSGVISPLQF